MRFMRAGFLVLLAAISANSLTPKTLEPIPMGYSVSVEFSMSTSKPDSYYCKATISDLETDDVITSPIITAKKGESAKIMTLSGPLNFTFDVSLDKTGKIGTYILTTTQGGKVVAKQKGSIAIR